MLCEMCGGDDGTRMASELAGIELRASRDNFSRIAVLCSCFECANDFLVLALNKLESCQLDEVGTLAAKNIIGWLTELWSCSSSAIYEEQLTRIVDIVTRYLNTAQRNIYEHAARCLATLASRKREKHENTSLIPAFFREEVLSTILTTISLAAGGSPSNEQHYEYLKSLCELLTTLGNFLSRVWKEELPPDNFGMYMSAIVAFFNHDSLEFKSVFFFDFRSRVHLLIVENIDVHFGHLLSIFESAVLKRVLLDPQQVIDAEWEAMIKFAKSVIAMACESKIADTVSCFKIQYHCKPSFI
uniref:Exportin-4 n=1 Tax=Angiostrongylus cantonensis TaxID=6313 RepID=A0A0K0D6G1_ANGCA